jgi:hypothetical protein
MAGALDFPPAPFPDSATIQAIKTPDELQTETEPMQHCVASYANRIYDGQYAVYRVLVVGAPDNLSCILLR